MDLKSDIVKRVKDRFSQKNNTWNFFHYLHKSDEQIEDLLGISFNDYVDYIKSSFNDFCNEKKGFHIDHIKPLNRAINDSEYLKFWHYTNTRAEAPKRNSNKSDLFEYEFFVFGDGFKERPIEKLDVFKNATKGQKEHIMEMTFSLPRRVEPIARIKLIGPERIKEIKEIHTEKYGYNSNKKIYNLKHQIDVSDVWYKYNKKNFYLDLYMDLKNNEKKWLNYRNDLLKNEVLSFDQINKYKIQWDSIKNKQ
ncbi:hypothetical protein OAN99_02265 [Flavobacteriaceae bacterium]|nr:hypothetical protein [Flavobacteriaceae bacterium]